MLISVRRKINSSILVILSLAFLILCSYASASEVIIGNIIKIDTEKGTLVLEVLRSSSKDLTQGTSIQLSAGEVDIGLKSLEVGQTVRVSVSSTSEEDQYTVQAVQPMKDCWCRDRTGVRYRLQQGFHRRGMDGRSGMGFRGRHGH